jgi:hypothetical protein
MKLTDTQLIVLNKAAQRSTMLALPLPPNLKVGAANKVVIPLIQKGLLEEIDADTRTGETIWRETRAGQCVTLAITEAGLAAIGIGPESEPKSKVAPKPAASKTPAKAPKEATGAKNAKPAKAAVPAKKAARKQATMIAMLQRKNGATIAEIIEATGWQQHTVRGAFAGALKKKLGLNIVSEKDEKRGRVYRID